MSDIHDRPLEYGAGLAFDYDVWTADTTLTLLNVTWDNNYKDVVRFPSEDELNRWIDKQTTTQSRITHSRRVKTTGSIKVQIPFNAARKFNYLRADNPVQPVAGDVKKTYYYFILDAVESAPQTTELIVQLDIYQTYIYDVRLGNAFVERGHVGVANVKRKDGFGRDYLSLPEGLDVGGEYQTVYERRITALNPANYNIMAVSTLDLTADPGTKEDPNQVMAPGGRVHNVSSGPTYYIWQNNSRFQQFLAKFKNQPWVTQGITHLSVVPNLLEWFPDFTWDDYDPAYYGKVFPWQFISPRTLSTAPGWRELDMWNDIIPERYKHVRDKFFTFPYMAVMMTTWAGDAIVIKPESWNNADGNVSQRINYTAPNQRVQVAPQSYNAPNGASVNIGDTAYAPLEDSGDMWNMAITMGEFPKLAILNDQSILYMANNAHGLAQQSAAADWSYQSAQRAAQTSFDQSMYGSDMNVARFYNSRAMDAANVSLEQRVASQKLLTGLLGSVGTGGLSAIPGVLNAGIDSQAASDALAIRNYQSGQGQDINRSQEKYLADSNKSLADFANKGNYEQAQAQIHARVQDAEMIPPALTTNVGGEFMNFVNREATFALRWKFIDPARVAAIGDYWLRWGYVVNRYVRNLPVDMHVMTKFTYWKLTETYILGDVPEGMKSVLRGIFEKGVTQYVDPADIGSVDMGTNAPLGGITIE